MGGNTTTDLSVFTPAARVPWRTVALTAAIAAVLLGTAVGVLSGQEDQGNLVRTGTPWVVAAFAVGAPVGRQTCAWTGLLHRYVTSDLRRWWRRWKDV
jgi:hypothetical protein